MHVSKAYSLLAYVGFLLAGLIALFSKFGLPELGLSAQRLAEEQLWSYGFSLFMLVYSVLVTWLSYYTREQPPGNPG